MLLEAGRACVTPGSRGQVGSGPLSPSDQCPDDDPHETSGSPCPRVASVRTPGTCGQDRWGGPCLGQGRGPHWRAQRCPGRPGHTQHTLAAPQLQPPPGQLCLVSVCSAPPTPHHVSPVSAPASASVTSVKTTVNTDKDSHQHPGAIQGPLSLTHM